MIIMIVYNSDNNGDNNGDNNDNHDDHTIYSNVVKTMP
jgi:hypothetical protein